MLSDLKHWVCAAQFEGRIQYVASDENLVLAAHGMCQDEGRPSLPPNVGFQLIVNGKEVAAEGPKTIKVIWNDRSFTLGPQHFFQSNPASWSWFHAKVHQLLQMTGEGPLWDAHAGSGFLTSAMGGREVYASEPSQLAVETGKRALNIPSFKVNWFLGTAEQWLARHPLSGLAGAVLDPPRTGLSKELVRAFVSDGPPVILMFSCDVATFARDLKGLVGYEPSGSVDLLNVNPGTSRFEIAVILNRKG